MWEIEGGELWLWQCEDDDPLDRQGAREITEMARWICFKICETPKFCWIFLFLVWKPLDYRAILLRYTEMECCVSTCMNDAEIDGWMDGPMDGSID